MPNPVLYGYGSSICSILELEPSSLHDICIWLQRFGAGIVCLACYLQVVVGCWLLSTNCGFLFVLLIIFVAVVVFVAAVVFVVVLTVVVAIKVFVVVAVTVEARIALWN